MAADPDELLAFDDVGRSMSDGWGDPALGGRWLYPIGPDGFAVAFGDGVMQHRERGLARLVAVNTSAGEIGAGGRSVVTDDAAMATVDVEVDYTQVNRAASASKDGGGASTLTAGAKATPELTRSKPSNAVYVPSSIDTSGSKNVRGALQRVINRAPNGSRIVFRAGATYRIGSALRISGRKNLTLDGNGGTLKPSGLTGKSSESAIIVESNSRNVTIRDLKIVGNNRQAGTSKACCDRQGQHGVAVYGSTDTLIKNVDIRRVWGDCVYVNASGPGRWADGVTYRDSVCRLTGRHAVGIIAGKNIRVLNNKFDELGFMVVDIEPNNPGEGAINVLVRGNDIGTYGLTDELIAQLLEAGGSSGSTVRNVTVTNNTVEGNRAGYDGRMYGLDVKVLGDRGERSNFTITNNTAGKPVNGPVMDFRKVKGVTVTGNKQPLKKGKLASFPGSSRVTFKR